MSSVHEGDVYLPLDAVTRIFSNLSQDDVHSCRQVCSSWNHAYNLVKRELPKRPVSLFITSNGEYRAVFMDLSSTKALIFAGQKYFIGAQYCDKIKVDPDYVYHNDQPSLPCHPTPYRVDNDDDYPLITKYGSFTPRHRKRVSKINRYSHRMSCTFNMPFFHHNQIGQGFGKDFLTKQLVTVYPRRKTNSYRYKLCTPPMSWYEKLAELLDVVEVRQVLFYHFPLRQSHSYMFQKYCGKLSTPKAVFHNISLRGVSPAEFQSFLTDFLDTDVYVFEFLEHALPRHITADLLMHPKILHCKTFCLQLVTDRNDEVVVPVHFDVSQDQLFEFFRKSTAKVIVFDPANFFYFSTPIVRQQFEMLVRDIYINQNRIIERYDITANF